MDNKLELYTKSDVNKNMGLTLFHCGWEKCLSGHSFGPAIRPHYLLHYILKGKGSYYVNNNVYNLTEGQAFLILPGESTYYEADKEEPWEYCWIGFDGYESYDILKGCNIDRENPILIDKSGGKFEKSLIELINNFENNNDNELALIGNLYLCFSNIYKPKTSKTKKHYEIYCNDAVEYIHNNFSYDIQVTDIAKHIGIDRTYLYKLFIKEYNISPQKYLIYYRLGIASNLLKTTKMNITEISFSCGFKDVPSFYKHFRKKFNITPVQFRVNNFVVLK
ncbi:MAG: AraC family transcriptional regulator [Clostridium sp.]|uniref:AraC family transcriptional regulator n=1 Tax=Clostridium sp. TaxID=1506 RepID=UPI003F2DDE8D